MRRSYKRFLENDEETVPRTTKYYRSVIRDQQNPVENHDPDDVNDLEANPAYIQPERNDTSEIDSSNNSDDVGLQNVYDYHSNNDNNENNSDASISDHEYDEHLVDDNNQEELDQGDASDDENEIFLDAQNIEGIEDYVPAYPGALITHTQSSALIMSYAIRHHISDLALTDLLLLINAHTPTIIHKSKYFFLQDFKENNVVHHFYCEDEHCRGPIKFLDGSTIDQCVNELCSLFGRDQAMAVLRQKKCFFLHLPLASQLAALLNKPEFFSELNKERDSSGVTSGKMYRDNVESGNIAPNDITIQWNTDGASAAKSSKCSIWPIQVTINELPYQKRKENIILTGLWQGPKPQMNTFLRPFVDELQELHNTGIILEDGRLISVHCIISSVDSVARPLLQNIKQFNGEHGCSYCLLPGERIERGYGTSRVYRGLAGEPRTEEQHLKDINEVVDNGLESSNGVKGPSLVLLIPMFNIITSFVPDYMHNVLLGVVRWFIFQWVDGTNSAQPWYLGANKTALLSKRLQNIKPPVEVTRPPRSLDDKKLWKASEFRSFLLYYSVPCLKDILPNQYFKHWLLLVFALTTLLKDKISAIDLQNAKAALTNFVLQTEHLYGAEFMTYNVHTLLHLPESVANWGAPWDCSTFMFEHFNGVLLNLFSGTQHISAQIFKNYNRIKLMNSLVNNNPLENWHPEAEKLLKNLSGKYLNLAAVRINTVVLLGAGKYKQLSVPEQIAIEHLCNEEIISVNVKAYKRCIFKGLKLCVVGYDRLIKRVNCFVRLQDNTCFEIHHLLDMCDTLPRNDKCIILGRQLHLLNRDICTNREIRSSSFIKLVDTENNVLMAIQPDQILRKCVKVVVNDDHYICDLVNSFERD